MPNLLKTTAAIGGWVLLVVFALGTIIRSHPDYPPGYEGYIARNAQERVVIFSAIAFLIATPIVIWALIRSMRQNHCSSI